MPRRSRRKDRSLEAILDRAESGAPKDSSSSGSSRSHSAALRSLQRLLVDNPKLIYQEIERLMAEDWEQGSSLPGVSHLPTTARGWLEHRSKIGAFAGAIRPSWIMAGAWDDPPGRSHRPCPGTPSPGSCSLRPAGLRTKAAGFFQASSA